MPYKVDEPHVDFEISKAHLEASGWGIDQYEGSNPFDCHAIYAYDFRYESARIFTYPIGVFNAHTENLPVESLATAVEKLLKKAHRKKIKGKDRQYLYNSIAGYVKASQVYKHWLSRNPENARMHAFINIYGGRGVPASVRPFISEDPRTVIPAEDAAQKAEYIRGMDLGNHPEWFVV